jgi:hypothetical protein
MANDSLFEHLNKSLQPLFVLLLNQDPLATMKAAHQLGGVQMSSRQAGIFRGKLSLKQGDQVEVAKNQQAWKGKEEEWQSKKDAVESFISLAERHRTRSIRYLQANVSARLWKCAECSEYFLAEDDRKGRLYCSLACLKKVRKATAKAAVYDKRAAARTASLRRARLAVRSWKGAGDWKPWVAKRSGVTVNWITYRVSDGELKAPA